MQLLASCPKACWKIKTSTKVMISTSSKKAATEEYNYEEVEIDHSFNNDWESDEGNEKDDYDDDLQ